MIFRDTIHWPMKICQWDMATDGSMIIGYSAIDADGERHAYVYKRVNGQMTLATSARYRLDADGKIWNKVGPDHTH